MLSITAINKILRRVMETGGLTPEMEVDIQKIQSEFNEREGILKEYGETFDGEDVEEYEFKYRVVDSSDEYKVKYGELHQRYLDRFFGGADVKEEKDVIDATEEKDVNEDVEIKELFKEKEEK